MRYTVTGVLAAGIAATVVALESGVSRLVDGIAEGGFGWLPQLDTAGQTAVAYMYASQAATFLLSFVAVAALGYWAGRRLDVTVQYRSLVGAIALGGVVGRLLGVGLAVQFVLGGNVTDFVSGSAFGLGAVLGVSVATAIHFALVGLAGAALAEFGFDPLFGGRSTRPSNDAVTDSG